MTFEKILVLSDDNKPQVIEFIKGQATITIQDDLTRTNFSFSSLGSYEAAA